MRPSDWDKYASKKKYLHEVISPFSGKNSEKILKDEIKKFASGKKSAIDLGTGLGFLLPFLSKNFKRVKAIDYSPKMIEYARKHNKLENVSLEVADMLKIKYKNLDVAIAVNSVIASSVKDVEKILKNIHSLLSKNGVLIAVLPSLESVLYCAMLVYEKKLKRYSEKTAREKTMEEIESRDYDFLLGFLKEKGGEQKHFYDFEIEYRFKKAGFKKIKIMKLHYPWKILEDKERYFPEEEPVWDWLVMASK